MFWGLRNLVYRRYMRCIGEFAIATKDMLLIWWNSEGVLYYELLPRGVIITIDIYCQQHRRLADAIHEKRPARLHEVMLLHNNTRSHSANLTQKHYTGVAVGSHSAPTLSPDLAPTDFYLFRSLFKKLPFRMKICSNMASQLQLKPTRFLQARNRKITPELADCCK